MDVSWLGGVILCKGNTVEYAAAEGDFVGVFKVVAYGNATGNGGDFYASGLQLFVEVVGGGVAFHGGGERKDDLFDGCGYALLYTLQEGGDVEVADADAIDWGDDAAKHVVEATVLLCVFDGHDVLDVFHHADDALGAFGTGADGAGVAVADGVAYVAVVDVGSQFAYGVRQLHYFVGGLFEQVEGKAKG